MMKRDISQDHPLRQFFTETLHDSLSGRLALPGAVELESYLTTMLIDFLNFDGIYAIRNAEGKRVESVVEMLAEGDVRQNASSFEREREVHRHIGDFLLFWSGLFPEYLGRASNAVDAIKQGQFSYYVVSTFEHEPFGQEAGTFRKLSVHFDDVREGLSQVRTHLRGLSA
jgi:hypothetical protein